MTVKQGVDHEQARYWNGTITRLEAQKVFDQTAGVIQAQQQTLAQLDACISYFADKLGVKAVDIQEWIKVKTAEAQKNSLEKAVEAHDADSDPLDIALQGEPAVSEPERITAA